MIRPVRADGSIDTGGVFVPVTRRRVIDRIASAAMQRVVLIVAPAGYGKSVALRQYLAIADGPQVRFDVLPDHAGLLGFLRGLSDALSEVAPDARTTLAGAYEKNAASQNPGADLALWMHAHLKSYRGIIAIDDLHIAQDDRDVTRFLSSLIDRTKGRVQWILASRSTLGLPIGTWLAYGDSDLAIDEHDLKFSPEEARDTARAFRLAVRDEELYELLNLTDGWATAMSFALRSSTRSVDLRNISSMTREMIYRYLAEQVYETLSDEERRFIEVASLLQRFDTASMVRAGFDRAAAMLDALRQRVAFVYEVEPDRYRLHDLFREFALHQFKMRGRDVTTQTIAGLAGVLVDSGETARALALYVEAGDAESIERYLESRGLDLVARGYADEVESALQVLSDSPSFERPLIQLTRGTIAIARGRYSEGEALLRSSASRIDNPQTRADVVLRLALMLFSRGEDITPLLEPLISDAAIDFPHRIEAQATFAGYLASVGEADRSIEHVRVVEASLSNVEDQERLARVVQRLGYALARLNRVEDARSRLSQAAEIATARGLWSLAARAYMQLSLIAILEDNQPSVSLWNAQQAANAATRAGDYLDLQTSLLLVLSIETRHGNAERAAQVERQLAELGSSDTLRTHYIASSQAQRHLWAGRDSEAHRLFATVLGRQALPADRLLVHALYALALALDGQSAESGKAAAAAQKAFEALTMPVKQGALVMEAARLFLVAAEMLNGRLTVAGRLLKKTPFSDHDVARSMRQIVEELLRLARTPSYEIEDFEARLEMLRDLGFGGYGRNFARVLERLKTEQMEPAEHEVTLTPSELRILRDLAAGMTPKDIAAEMGRSVYTVQTHVQNLIEKLGCHGRAEAIAAARRRGLLASGGNGPT